MTGLSDVYVNMPDLTGALCAQVDSEIFFPERGDGAAAKRVCAACPVRVPCLQYALDADVEFGVWAGVGQSERQRIRRRTRPPAHLSQQTRAVLSLGNVERKRRSRERAASCAALVLDDGLSHEEVATRLGLAVRTVDDFVRAARKAAA